MAIRAASAEVSVGQDQGGHQRPGVDGQTHPAGGDLHPHRGPLAGQGGVLCVRAGATNKEHPGLTTPNDS